ncbi:hypothetical protein NHQ30_007603 [Ciborinia camelliae]|nr:hypothetical protein NHQ30_007603 [Ciborinia camelliae]
MSLFRCDTPMPALFSVCREARMEAKKHYKKAIVANHTFKFFSVPLVPRFYTNPDCDTICPVGPYSKPEQKVLLDAMNCSQMQTLALDETQWNNILCPKAPTGSEDYSVETWLEGATNPPRPLKSVVLFMGPRATKLYKNGPGSAYGDIWPHNWESLSPQQKCALCAAISKFKRYIVRLRDGIQQQIRIDVITKIYDIPRLPIAFPRGTTRSIPGSPESLKIWSPSRIELMIDNVPAKVRRLLGPEELLPYLCDDTTCKVCY